MKVGDIDKVAAVLRGFTGLAVIVVPGNHDYYAGSETELWQRFRRVTEGDAHIDLLVEPVVKSYDVEGQAVHFFPCACPLEVLATAASLDAIDQSGNLPPHKDIVMGGGHLLYVTGPRAARPMDR